MAAALSAQLQERMVKVNVVPDHVDWKYELGEKVKFNVVVTKNRVPQENVTVWYEVAQDMMHPLLKDTIVLENGVLTLDAGTMKTPGFLRCRVWTKYDGRTVEGRATAAFEPEKIKPTAVLPNDFNTFWENAKQENVRIPMNAKLRLLPERCTEKVNVYEWNVQNYRLNSRGIWYSLCAGKAREVSCFIAGTGGGSTGICRCNCRSGKRYDYVGNWHSWYSGNIRTVRLC